MSSQSDFDMRVIAACRIALDVALTLAFLVMFGAAHNDFETAVVAGLIFVLCAVRSSGVDGGRVTARADAYATARFFRLRALLGEPASAEEKELENKVFAIFDNFDAPDKVTLSFNLAWAAVCFFQLGRVALH